MKRCLASISPSTSSASPPASQLQHCVRGHRKSRPGLLRQRLINAYRLHMAGLAKLSPLEIWHSRIDLEKEIDRIAHGGLRRKLAGVVAKARSEGLSKDDNFPHLASENDMRIVDKPPTIFHLNPKADIQHRLSFQRVLDAYREGVTPDRLRLLDRFAMKQLVFKASASVPSARLAVSGSF